MNSSVGHNFFARPYIPNLLESIYRLRPSNVGCRLWAGYISMMIPSNMLLSIFKPRIYLPTVVIIWGIVRYLPLSPWQEHKADSPLQWCEWLRPELWRYCRFEVPRGGKKDGRPNACHTILTDDR